MSKVTTQHVFELAHLGKAPFVLTGVRENVFKCGNMIKAGGTCDYCSNGIRWEFLVRSADGKNFKVGCDCALKLDRNNNREFVASVEDMQKRIASATRERKAERIRKEKCKLIDEAKKSLENKDVRDLLSERKHPMIAGKTLLDYCEFLMTNAGQSGQVRAAKIVLAK